jgi:hypothetical protein
MVLAAVLCAGCMSEGPLLNNPEFVGSAPPCEIHNPVYLPQGPEQYGQLWEMVSDVVSDYFEISYANRYDGRIVTYPHIAPGVGQFFKPGSPTFHERVLATFQTIRHRAEISIQPADAGGFLVDVKVFKEVEDLPAPSNSLSGAAAFRNDPSLQRVEEVITGDTASQKWVPLGRAVDLEQRILERVQRWDRRPGH